MIETIFKKENIFIDIELEERSKTCAINKISELSYEDLGVSKSCLHDAFFEREALASTGFGNGFAIPHAKIKGLRKPRIGVFRFIDEIEWQSIDNKDVRVAIAMMMPAEDDENIHLKVLAKFARQLVHSEFMDKLLYEKDNETLYKYIIKEMEE